MSKFKGAKMSEDLSQFGSDPEKLRTLDDSRFEEYAKFVTGTFGAVFCKGLGWVPEDPESDEVRVKLSEGQDRGRIFCCELPKDAMTLFRVLAEESLIRRFGELSLSILADMVVRRNVYAGLWDSFGEYNVFQKQLTLKRNREARHRSTVCESKPLTNEDVVEFRNQFANQVAAGRIRPLSTEEIMKTGFDFLGQHYDAREGTQIHGLPVRFRSRLSFATNSSPPPNSPYQFSLGYGDRANSAVDFSRIGLGGSKIEKAYERKEFGVKVFTDEVASAPTLAPDMSGWTPHSI